MGGPGLQLQDRRLGTIYLAVAWPLFLLLIALTPEGDYYFVSFALFPQTWALLSRRAAVWSPWRSSSRSAWCAFSTLPQSTSALMSIVVSSAITLALSLGMGLLIHVLTDEMERRADTIEELHAPRPTSPPPSVRRVSSPSASGSPARSTTRSPRASPLS